jgi:hypothetical protein
LKEQGKLVELGQMIAHGLQPPDTIFVATKERAKQIYEELKYKHVHYLSTQQSQTTESDVVCRSKASWWHCDR